MELKEKVSGSQKLLGEKKRKSTEKIKDPLQPITAEVNMQEEQ